MLRKAKFRVDFKVWQSSDTSKGVYVKMSEDLTLPCRTEETNMHSSSTVYRAANAMLRAILGTSVEIKHIYVLTDYEEIMEIT